MATEGLYHYIIVRRDLPLGVLASQIVHAAGESVASYETGACEFYGATAVILEVKDEAKLLDVMYLLRDNGIQHVRINEDSLPYNGALMAIGVIPQERGKVGQLLKDLQTLKTLTPLEPEPCSCSNCRAEGQPPPLDWA